MQQDYHKPTQISDNQEIDLGIFLTLVQKVFNSIKNFIITLFVYLINLLLFLVLCIKKWLLWLSLGALAGLCIGLYIFFQKGNLYFSEMVVETNFNSSRFLYNEIKNLNAAIKNGDQDKLAAIFNIDKKSASKISSFEIAPVDHELQKINLYKKLFLIPNRKDNVVIDTIWNKTMKYEAFKNDLENYDYSLHTIRVYTYSTDDYIKIGDGINNLITKNAFLSDLKNSNQKLLIEEQDILNNSLRGIDSLRNAYNRQINNETALEKKGLGSELIINDRVLRNPEIDLYDKELLLKDELIRTKKTLIEQKNILNIYSGFTETGTKVSIWKEILPYYCLIGFIIPFVVLLILEGYKKSGSIKFIKNK